jgi:hypothetical protein
MFALRMTMSRSIEDGDPIAAPQLAEAATASDQVHVDGLKLINSIASAKHFRSSAAWPSAPDLERKANTVR